MANFNFNKAILGGRLSTDVELKQTPNGVSVCTFSIAVNRKFQKEGEQQADFINCVAWRNSAEFISRYFKKGSSICITGNIQTRTWTDQNNQKRYATEVVVDEAMFVDSKSDNQSEASGSFIPGTTAYTPDAYKFTAEAPKFEEIQEDEKLPF